MTDKRRLGTEIGKRFLKFRKIRNFRDLGGYPAEDGRTVRWGSLYRSGHLGKLSRKDRKKFEALQIDTVIDLRSEEERNHKPNRLPEENSPDLLELSILDEANALMNKEIRSRIYARKYDELDSAALMRNAYSQFAVEFLEEFRQVVQTILAAEGKPVLWHCSAGKDRTGFAAAILLRLLGVSEEIVMEDYLLSNKYVDLRRGQMILLRLLRGQGAVDLVRPLLTVRADWLEASFQAVLDTWGTFEQYAAEGLNLSSGDINQLKSYLLV